MIQITEEEYRKIRFSCLLNVDRQVKTLNRWLRVLQMERERMDRDKLLKFLWAREEGE